MVLRRDLTVLVYLLQKNDKEFVEASAVEWGYFSRWNSIGGPFTDFAA
jgi:hypothetical protein